MWKEYDKASHTISNFRHQGRRQNFKLKSHENPQQNNGKIMQQVIHNLSYPLVVISYCYNFINIDGVQSGAGLLTSLISYSWAY